MQPSYRLTSTHKLLEDVAYLEARLIAGTARNDEIDAYVAMQIELVDRELMESLIDPRD